MSLESKVVVVLGGSTGMGFATAKAAAAEGAQVVITGRSQEKLQAALAQLPAGSQSAALDVADEAGTRSLFEQLDHVDHIFITAATVTFGIDARERQRGAEAGDGYALPGDRCMRRSMALRR